MTDDGNRTSQSAAGSYNAQAQGHSTAIVNVFQAAPAAEVDPARLAEGERRLAGVPLDDLPDPGALPAGSAMAWRRNHRFVGREEDLRTLARVLKQGGASAVGQSPTVTGWGGVGKTQLAAEFAYRYGPYFAGGVFWLNFAEPDAIPAEIARCGGPQALHLHPRFDDLPLNQQIGLVAGAWHSDLPRLLVFDNCEEEALFEAWCPRSGACRVLITSRRSVWRGELGVRVVALDQLPRADSLQLLRQHRPDPDAADADLDAIAAELGDLPLALYMAGSFLERYRHEPFGQPAAYLDALRQPDLLAHPSLTDGERSPTGHDQHVARTFEMSLRRLDAEDADDAMALAALARAAWFAPGEPIPRWLLRRSLDIGDQDEAAGMRFADALRRLRELGLLEQDDASGDLVLHRLVAAFVRHRVDAAATARDAVEAAVDDGAKEQNALGYPGPLLAWQAHLRAVAETAARAETANSARLLNELGYHLQMIADYAGARHAYERALAIAEEALGPDHPNVAIRVNNLGSVLHDQGDFDGARKALERALHIDEQALGPDHPNVAIRVNNLGFVFSEQGDIDGARKAYERALAIFEASLGIDHPNSNTVRQNLKSLDGKS